MMFSKRFGIVVIFKINGINKNIMFPRKKKTDLTQQGSLYYQPKQCTIIFGKSLKIAISLYCLIPPKWVPFNDPCPKVPGNPWRIIPVRKELVTPIYEPFSPIGRGPTTRSLGDLLTMVITVTTYKSWDDPPSTNQAPGHVARGTLASRVKTYIAPYLGGNSNRANTRDDFSRY